MSILSPKDLPNTEYYRLTNEDETHHGLTYRDGLNEDPIAFNPEGQCRPGGMYFFSKEQLPNFHRFCFFIKYVRKVTFPDDARIYSEEGKYKANKFILGPRKKFYLDDFFSLEICLAAVKESGDALWCVKQQTPEICLAAVQQNGLALEYVREQTPEICLAAVKENGYALEYVKDQTREIRLAAERVRVGIC